MEKLLTRWGRELDREKPLNDYPRPQMKRNSFINLNGIWDYAIYPKYMEFSGYQGQIVVPFSPECILSGVEKTVTPEDVLYYRKKFVYSGKGSRVLLHFGAVDYSCRVHLNGKAIGSHKGGYFPFSFEITDIIKDGENELTLSVTDPSETGSQASGKQTSKRGGIWYTPQSGIWQTVWIEEVPGSYIENVRLTPDIDNSTLSAEVTVNGSFGIIRAQAIKSGKVFAEASSTDGNLILGLDGYDLWTPENPVLYDLRISIDDDEVLCYFGMRKFSLGKDQNGFTRMMLNNKPYFQNGLLDQGYWSDGMYTAPDDEALIYDIVTMKEMGFNMLRKHIKIEPLRWYYHCDRLGMLVWQDMISGGSPINPLVTAVTPGVQMATGTKNVGHLNDGPDNYKLFSREDPAGRAEYYIDSERMINELYNCVSLCLWVPFNEGWGQFDAVKACKFYREKDPTRLIDHASGFHDQGAGDLNSFHIYFTPFFFPKWDKHDERAIALTEFGGYAMKTEGHVFNSEKFFGYRKYNSRTALESAIRKLYINRLLPLVSKKGLSALVYTEVSDVEDETNGLLTYDREVTKVDIRFMKSINSKFRF